MSKTTESLLRPGNVILATVKLRPETMERRAGLARYNGLRSQFLATFLYTSGRYFGEFALAHKEWQLDFIASGDVDDIEISDEDPLAYDDEGEAVEELIDFLDLSERPESDTQMRRYDLEELRHASKIPGYQKSWISHDSKKRLVAAGMLELHGALTFATEYGQRTARYNSSRRTGYEGQPVRPASWRQTIEDEKERGL